MSLDREKFYAELDALGPGQVADNLKTKVYLGASAALAEGWLAKQSEASKAETLALALAAAADAKAAVSTAASAVSAAEAAAAAAREAKASSEAYLAFARDAAAAARVSSDENLALARAAAATARSAQKEAHRANIIAITAIIVTIVIAAISYFLPH
jgi:hypothetical protein